MKDLLLECPTWNTLEEFEEVENRFCSYVRQLPPKMEVCDQQRVVKAMKDLHAALKIKFKPFEKEYYEGRKSYCAILVELIEKHPCVVDQPWFENLFSDLQKMSFRLRARTIASRKRRTTIYDVNVQCIQDLQAKLQVAEDKFMPLSKMVERVGTLIDCVASIINTMDPDKMKRSGSAENKGK